jgi:DNA-binding MurR/RpiR family transcriptional regulator
MREHKHSAKGDRFGERLAKRSSQLTPALRRVADYINAHRESVMTMSAAELGVAIDTSDATVIRAVQALGFSGFRDLKRELASAVGHGATPADNMMRTLATIDDVDAAVEEVIAGHMEAMTHVSTSARAQILEAISVLAPARRIAFYGIGPTSALAQYAHVLFTRSGHPGLLLNAGGSGMADDLLHLQDANALLMLAYGSAYPEAEAAVAEASRLELPIVLISDSLDERLSKKASVVVPAPRGRAGNVALHGATLVCLEAILLGVVAKEPGQALSTLQKLNELRRTVRGRRKPG